MTDKKDNSLYLGRLYDHQAGGIQPDALHLDPEDLTTHAFITGMTGSGKTGLGVALLEEAALKGIPAIVIDPKGDLPNLLLHFPEQRQEDFEPWIDPEEARRQGVDVGVLAQKTAKQWSTGLADWGYGREQLEALGAVDYCVYTPGSSAGVPVNVLSSLASPGLHWEENREVLRERISSTTTALLGLIGLGEIDPLRSREHILLSNLIERAWSQDQSLDLNELILQVQTPPFDRLGAFPLERFFPEKDRFDLALLLNNFLASPSFQTWMEGQSLDIPALLYTPGGRPRHSIFYLAHLPENERMFIVTLLLSSVETWMRSQRGTSGLRALIYFDEILGYIPPVQNPPSRPVLLRLLKQARAFGVGLVLATQNPVDLDYKGLSNVGTWMIGRLQTEQDKARLLDGLMSASGLADRGLIDRMISELQKRVFFLHSVHRSRPVLFHSRWALNFLAGPLTRSQLPALNQESAATQPVSSVGAGAADRTTQAAGGPIAAEAPASTGYSGTRPATPGGVTEYFLPVTRGVSQAAEGLRLSGEIVPEGIVYRPALLAQAEVRYLNRRYNLDAVRQPAALVSALEGTSVRWEEHPTAPLESGDIGHQPEPQAGFAPLPAWMDDARRWKAWESDFVDWVYRTGTLRVQANETLKVYGDPEMTPGEFRELCSEAARAALEADTGKIDSTFEKKIAALEKRLARQASEVEEQEDEVKQRQMEELGTHGELLLSVFNKRRRSLSSSLTKRRLSQKARADLKQEQEELAELQKDLDEMEKAYQSALDERQEYWSEVVMDVTEIPVSPYKKDIFMEYFGLVWRPFYRLRIGEEVREVEA